MTKREREDLQLEFAEIAEGIEAIRDMNPNAEVLIYLGKLYSGAL